MGARADSGLSRLRRRVARRLWAEALLVALGPACGVLAVFVILALLGVAAGWLFGTSLLVALGLAGVRLRGVRWPGAAAIDRRIEAVSNLRHQPLAVLEDAPEDGAEYARQLWQAHVERAKAALAGAQPGGLRLELAVRDKLALRGLLLLGLLSSAVVAGPAGPGRVAGAVVWPNLPFGAAHVTGWITPPDYAGVGPVSLTPGARLSTLAGSKLTVIIDKAGGHPAIEFGNAVFARTRLGDAAERAEATLTRTATLSVGPWWHRLGHWRIDVTQPTAPVVKLSEAKLVKPNLLELRWQVSDNYGLAGLSAVFKPVGYSHAVALSFALPVKRGAGAIFIDLTKSPFAGVPVGLTLAARNLAGVSAQAVDAHAITTPGLALHDPTARQLASWRLQLACDPGIWQKAAAALGQVSQAPPSAITAAADVQLAALAASLGLGTLNVEDGLVRLLALEQEIEAGPDYEPGLRFAASNQALLSALAQGLKGQPADAARLQALLAQLHQTMAAHIAALQRAAVQPPGPAAGRGLDFSGLDRMVSQIAADEAAGRHEQAQAKLKALARMLNRLANARPMTPAERAQAMAASAAGNAISQMSQDEAALLDAQARGQQPNAGAQAQAAIAGQLAATTKALAQAGLDIPGLGKAGQQMQAAGQALAAGQHRAAMRAVQGAIEHLQNAASALAATQRQMSMMPGGADPDPLNPDAGDDAQGGPGEAPDEAGDPGLGRGQDNPAAVIQRQIMERDGEPGLAAPVHEYFHKLLQDAP